jgi:Flp pilus assembly protein TadG
LEDHKLLRDNSGSVLVEYTIVFPIFILLILATVDVASMLSEWSLASKAAYIGARTAVVADAVANGITNLTYDSTKTGQLCFVPSTGLSSGACPAITATSCTGTSSGVSCTGGNNTAFTLIFNRMKAIYPKLQRTNVTVSYASPSTPTTTYPLGFNGEPNGAGTGGALPVNVTVTINNDGSMTHQFFFIGPIMNFFGGFFPNAVAIPQFATTLPSEAMDSANL